MADTHLLRIGVLLIAGALAGCNKGPTAPAAVTGPVNPGGSNAVITYALSGTISETGGGSIGGVYLTTDRGKSATTDEHGQYRIEGLSGHVSVRLQKPGFEPGWTGAILDRDQVANGAIQREIHIGPDQSMEVTVFRDDDEHDLAYALCPGPCKKIRSAGPGGTLISIRARARDESRRVCLLVDGGPPHHAMPTCSAAEVTATTTLFFNGGEFQFYVSFADGYREGAQSVEVSVMLGTKP